MTLPTTQVSVPRPSAAPVYPPKRGQAVGVFLRNWAREQYGEEGIRSELAENLGVPSYRPAFRPDAYYGDVMREFVDHIVARAEEAAGRVPFGAHRLAVLRALQNATSGKGQ